MIDVQQMNNQQEINQKKASQSLKSFQELYLRLSINKQQPQIIPYPISSDNDKTSNILKIKVDTILKIASSLIMKKKIKINKFMNVFVQIDNKLINVFKLKKNSFGSINNIVKLKRQDQTFYLNIWIFDLNKMDKSNALIQLTTQQIKYQKVMNRLQQINQVFTKQLQNLNDQQKSSYDIAYFFAQPLVQPDKIKDFPNKTQIYQNLKLQKYRASGSDVSFQKQYDKFIDVLQDDQFFSNITIQMMVATENNIRQVLSERCNILHFSCHGQTDYLKIQKDRNVGYLDALTTSRLIKLLDGKILPKIIIFNACHSKKIAFQIHQRFPTITTIGYQGQADDTYCEVLTQRLYEGIYKRREPFFKLFQQVKKQIASKNQTEAKKLFIFQSQNEPKFDHQKTEFVVNQKYNINWAYFQNLGSKQPIGVKKTLFQFIKNYLLNKDKTKFFVVGDRQSGKTIFIKKALYFTMHRCVFRQKLQIDLLKGQNPIVNMLQLKLQYKKQIYDFVKENKSTNIIIIVDHCNDLIRNDPEQFMKFFKKLQKQIKLGKIILITDNISYFMEINVMIDQNVYSHEEVLPIKVRDQYCTYMNRWHPSMEKNYQKFHQNRIKNWFEALRSSNSKQNFFLNLQKLNQKDKLRQNQKLMVDLEAQFNDFKHKIVKAQRSIKSYLTSGYFSRTQECFVFLSIFQTFQKINQSEEDKELSRLQRRQKYSYLAQLSKCYEEDIKNLICLITQALGKFHTQNHEKNWWQKQLFFVIQKLFVIIGLTILIKDSKQIDKQVKQQLYNAYTLIVKIFNRYQKLLSQSPRLMAQCQSMRLKIYMALYNFYKHQQYIQNVKQKNKLRKGKSQGTNNQIDLKFNFSFLNTIPQVDTQKDSIPNFNDSNNNIDFAFRDSIASQRDSINMFGRQGRDSIKTQKECSGVRDSIVPNNVQQQSNFKEKNVKKQSIFNDFQAQLKEQYGQSEYWQLIQKVQELDTMIRMIQYEQLKPFSIENAINNNSSSMFDFSSSQNQRVFETYYHSIQKFYKLHHQITVLYERFSSSMDFDQDQQELTFKIKRIFFSQVELQLSYLQGLKLIEKLFTAIDDQYFFEYEAWYKQKLKNIRQKLVKNERILDHSISKKLNKDKDLSFKKVYKQYLQIYIDLRFKLEKLFNSFTTNGQKQTLNIFNKLLKLSQDAKSIQLKNRIQQFIEKNFYNKCSVLISEPIGYIPKTKKKYGHQSTMKFTGKQKDKKNNKFKGKQTQNQSQYQRFYPLNIYRASDLIVNEIQNAAQKKILSQIHIETQIFNTEKLKTFSAQKVQQDSKKKRLIYLILCDCKKGQNHESIFLQNQHGESIKNEIRKLLSNKNIAFPYAPIIILYGSNTQLLESYYRQYSQSIGKKIAIISFTTSNKLPDIDQTFKKMFEYVWNQYLQKHIGMTFLANFWIKFCQIYFDEEHESFKNQVIRSFNIAKQDSLILLKKKYLSGLGASQLQKQIDNIVKKLSLYIEKGKQLENPINLQNNLKDNFYKDFDINTMNFCQSKEDDFLRSSALYQSVRKQDEILSLYNHQIGCNYQIHEFLRQFFTTIDNFQKDKQFLKNWIEYFPQLNETNSITFSKTIYHKLSRLGNKFQLGVEYKNMQNFRLQQSDLFSVFEDSLATSTTFHNMDIGISQQIKEQNQMGGSSNLSELQTIQNKRKKVQIYYNVAYKDLKAIVEGFTTKDESIFYSSMGFGQMNSSNTSVPTIFRILIVDTDYIQNGLQDYLQTNHCCRIHKYIERQSYIENLYHACDAILNYSRRVEGFNFMKMVDTIYSKKEMQQELKHSTARQVKQKIIQYFEKYY